ncbi:hypothetical protein SFRURICE_013943 [Spodoptera frugiperda]|uniref:SFRICE_008277 n=1 Tax=Spodoptera frugiperda TaxID=7108 RepID=A0A2H1WID6_SPOFR|nr:hypothetical protein SFRURICE_013943 [Spodoptera frugiperda]
MYSLRTNILILSKPVDAREKRCREARKRRLARRLMRIDINPFTDVPEAEFICDSDLNILCAHYYYYSAHDSTVWKSHPLSLHLKQITENTNEQMTVATDTAFKIWAHSIQYLLMRLRPSLVRRQWPSARSRGHISVIHHHHSSCFFRASNVNAGTEIHVEFDGVEE